MKDIETELADIKKMLRIQLRSQNMVMLGLAMLLDPDLGGDKALQARLLVEHAMRISDQLDNNWQ